MRASDRHNTNPILVVRFGCRVQTVGSVGLVCVRTEAVAVPQAERNGAGDRFERVWANGAASAGSGRGMPQMAFKLHYGAAWRVCP